MDKLFDILKSLLDDLTPRRRWTAVFGFVASVLVLLVIFELFTGVFFYRSLRQKVELLATLSEIEQKGIVQSPELYPVFRQTVVELSSRNISPIVIPRIIFRSTETVWKAIGGGIIWFFIAVAALFGALGRDTSNRIWGAVLMLVMAGASGFIATLIPTVGTLSINVVLGVLAQFGVLLIISKLGSGMKKTTRGTTGNASR
jgi:hypothetical protein